MYVVCWYGVFCWFGCCLNFFVVCFVIVVVVLWSYDFGVGFDDVVV